MPFLAPTLIDFFLVSHVLQPFSLLLGHIYSGHNARMLTEKNGRCI
jgi:hypothetical protein